MVRRTGLRALVGVVVLAFGVAGCNSDSNSSPTPTSPTPTPTPAATTASLTGTVSNSSSERIGGAIVTVLDGPDAGTSVGTNSNGEYSFASLTIGNANLSAAASLYQEFRAGVAIDGTNTLNFTLARQTVALGGNVTASTGEAISGATVTVLDGANVGVTAVTSSSGSYQFTALTAGNANFKATASLYDEDRRGVLVNGTNSLNFTLTLTPVAVIPSITITGVIVSGGTGTAQEWKFTATTNQAFVSYNWNFGDGSSASNRGAVEQHLYSTFATRTVTVTGVRHDAGWHARSCDQLIIGRRFLVAARDRCAGLSATAELAAVMSAIVRPSIDFRPLMSPSLRRHGYK